MEHRKVNRVLFVERSGELRGLARLRTESLEPKGNQVLIGHVDTELNFETICLAYLHESGVKTTCT